MQSAALFRHLLVALRILVLALIALTLFGLTALICVAFIARGRYTPGILLPGVLCGLIVWLFIAVFHINRERVLLPFSELPLDDPEALMRQLTTELGELGYEPGAEVNRCCTFRPGFTNFLFGGSVRVELGEEGASLRGPKLCLERIRKRLRLHNHVQNAQQNFRNARARDTRQLLRRVQMDLLVPVQHWEGVYQDVIEVLLQEGAEVSCSLGLLAQCRAGIPESTVELDIRERLRQKGISASIAKEHLPSAPDAPKAEPSPRLLPHQGSAFSPA